MKRPSLARLAEFFIVQFLLQSSWLAAEPAPASADWVSGQGVSLGGIFFPHLHFNAVYGASSAEEPDELASGHHDPNRDGWTIQGFEPGVSVRLHEQFQAFAGSHFSYDQTEDTWDGEMEEYFAKITELPFGLELRGGKFLNRFGFHNATHLHGWDFADTNLPHGRFFGDDGLYTVGGELTWTLPIDSMQWTSLLSVAVGKAQREGGHEHHADAHEPSEEQAASNFEPEGALFDSTLVSGNWTNIWRISDFHQVRGGLSGVWGKNVWDRTTQIYGLHLEYQWRENGLESGGRYFRWRTEAMVRHFGARSGHLPGEEPEEEHSSEAVTSRKFTEFGLSSSVVAGWPTSFAGPIEAGLRLDYVSGQSLAGLEERWRVSPGLRLYFSKERTVFAGVQANFDYGDETGSNHSVWLQVGLNWGGAEVR